MDTNLYHNLPMEVIRHIISFARPIYPYMTQLNGHIKNRNMTPCYVKYNYYLCDTRPAKRCLNPNCENIKTYNELYNNCHFSGIDVEKIYRIGNIDPFSLCENCFEAFAHKHNCFMMLEIYNSGNYDADPLFDHFHYEDEYYFNV